MFKTTHLLETVLAAAKVHPTRVRGCYVFGSRVYGTASENSDIDIILVANASAPEVEVKTPEYNVHIIVPDVFAKYVKDNHIKGIECVFAPDWAKIVEYPIEFIYKPESFRHNISHTVSNSWVKCKKKLEQDEYYIGVKSLFHALRIADFGIQFAKNGMIDYSTCNEIWREINSRKWTWEELDKRFKSVRNEKLSQFRQLTTKYNGKTIID